MNKDEKNLAKSYQKIIESVNISNNMTQDVSTKYYPLHDMDEEEKYTSDKEKILKKLEIGFSKVKSLIDSCTKNCNLAIVSELCDLLENPEFKTDLTNLKMAIQSDNVKTGENSRLTSF